jgi:hypothetical protein
VRPVLTVALTVDMTREAARASSPVVGSLQRVGRGGAGGGHGTINMRRWEKE